MLCLSEVEQNTISIMNTGIRFGFQLFSYSTIVFQLSWLFNRYLFFFKMDQNIFSCRSGYVDQKLWPGLHLLFPTLYIEIPNTQVLSTYLHVKGGIHLSNKFNIELELFILQKGQCLQGKVEGNTFYPLCTFICEKKQESIKEFEKKQNIIWIHIHHNNRANYGNINCRSFKIYKHFSMPKQLRQTILVSLFFQQERLQISY